MSRNYGHGAVTHLSPYLSRGVISTRQVYAHIMRLGLSWQQSEKLVQELAWRDYWQQVWLAKGAHIKSDLRHQQAPVVGYGLPTAITEANTGIKAVDKAIHQLYETGYMHNHMRMYVASICCNIAKMHWLQPAQWMYSHLLDGDLASNYLSWQWIAGTFFNKRYYANQENINKFFGDTQRDTFLDVGYEALARTTVPERLARTTSFTGETPLPTIPLPALKHTKTTLIYNYYNLDPYWYADQEAQRVFLLEPTFFKDHPVSQLCIDFAIHLAKNIKGIKIFIGEFTALQCLVDVKHLIFKEHPTAKHYQGKVEPRDWLSNVHGYFPSFFAFWKKCKKELLG